MLGRPATIFFVLIYLLASTEMLRKMQKKLGSRGSWVNFGIFVICWTFSPLCKLLSPYESRFQKLKYWRISTVTFSIFTTQSSSILIVRGYILSSKCASLITLKSFFSWCFSLFNDLHACASASIAHNHIDSFLQWEGFWRWKKLNEEKVWDVAL